MKKSVLLFALCMYIFVGCNQEPQDVIDQEECQVEVSFTTDFTESLLKSVASNEEKAMEKVILFGVDATGDYVEKYLISTPVIGDQPLTIYKRIKTLYAIATPTDAIDALTNQNSTALEVLVGSFSGAPDPTVKAFLMGGKGTVVENSGTYKVNIELIRTVAKVDFASSTTGLVIESVTVKNTPNNVYVFKQTSAAVPSPAGRVDYAAVLGATPVVYVAESVNPDGETTNTTTFEVQGTFDGKRANYPITLKTGTNNLSIERNKHYSVCVTATSTTSCTINISIPDWGEGGTGNYEIPYEDFTTQP